MTDYYKMAAKPEKKRDFDGLILLLLLLFLLGIGLTLWSLRAVPEENGLLQTAALQAAPKVEPAAAAPVSPKPEPELDAAPSAAQAQLTPEILPEAPPPPLFSDARWRQTAQFNGTDAAGRTAAFTAYVLVGDETWTFARADSIFAVGLDEPVETAFANLNLGAGICDLSGVVAIGAASVEGTSVQNTFLSHTRGHALKAAIAANLPCEAGALPASVLDLGYSRAEVACPAGEKLCPALSAPQRPIAMILVDAEDPAADIGDALRTGIEAQEAAGEYVLPGVKVSDYSAFDLR